MGIRVAVHMCRVGGAGHAVLAMLCGIVLLTTLPAGAQTLSTDVFPSEDELLEALRNGDIDLDQYRVLMEFVTDGIDSAQAYLLDQIPNLSSFDFDTADATFLQSEQANAFREQRDQSARVGQLRSRYAQQLDPDQASSYRTTLRLFPMEHWRLSATSQRDYTGHERLTERSVGYRSRTGVVRNVQVGSFRSRLGLGTVYGNHNRLLDQSEGISRETFLYPSSSGFNGLYLEAAPGRIESRVLASYNRDSAITLASTGLSLGVQLGRFRPVVTFGYNRLTRRTNSRHSNDSKLALTGSYRVEDGEIAGELCSQLGDHGGLVASVVEGRHRIAELALQYAAWSYADRFLDLTAGSKAGALTRKDTLEDIGFDYSEKRTGQWGGFARVRVPLSTALRFSNAILHSERHRDTSNTQILTAFEYGRHSPWSAQIDYLATLKRKSTLDGDEELFGHRVRLEQRFRTDKLTLRAYIGLTLDSHRKGTGMLFAHLRYDSGTTGIVEFWSNLGRVTPDAILYWYNFVRSEQRLWGRSTAAVKVTHRYSRSESQHHRVTVGLELKAAL